MRRRPPRDGTDPASLLHDDDLYLDDDLGQLPAKEKPVRAPGLTTMTTARIQRQRARIWDMAGSDLVLGFFLFLKINSYVDLLK
jgi:hypothetical protein